MDITLTELLTGTLKRNRSRTAIRIEDQSWSYDELNRASNSVAIKLRVLGIQRGDCVALYLRNSWEYVVADIAILKLAAIKVPLNEYQSASDVAYILSDTDARVLIGHQSLLSEISEVLDCAARPDVIVSVSDTLDARIHQTATPWSELVQPENSSIESMPTPLSSDIAMITYTGGTTGKPKGVVQTQQSLAINLFAHIVAGELAHDEVMMLTTPLPHSAGYHMQACLLAGGQVLLKDSFSPSQFFSDLARHGVTWTFLVPTMIYRLIDAGISYDPERSTLRTIVYGAAPMSTARLQSGLEMFGTCFLQLFGQTECPNYITTLSKEDHMQPALHASCGRATAMVEIRTDAEDGKGSGEIMVKSPYLLSEYFKNPEQTAKALQDGWLLTGDIGYIDEGGYLFLQDRAKDMIITGGLNVYSNEVEQVLKQHDAVVDAAVVGLPHADWGEKVHAVVVARAEVDSKLLIDFCKQVLSRYKVPKSIEFRDSLPLTPYNKVDKKALRSR